MNHPKTSPKYAARLNAFKSLANNRGILGMIEAAGLVDGMDAADLNFPDHISSTEEKDIIKALNDNGLKLNGLAMRYYSEPAFALGAFTNPDKLIRQKAIDLTKRGIDTLRRMSGDVMTLWMGQDGFDYPMQADYSSMWENTVDALDQVTAHDPNCKVAIEYKPNEPRANALLHNMATTLLAIREIGADNIGVTIDFAHILYAGEMPAFSAFLANRYSKIFGIHLNDGYGKRDDGLMAGTINPVATVELFIQLKKLNYEGVIYFDTFPDHSGLNPIEESYKNPNFDSCLDRICDSPVNSCCLTPMDDWPIIFSILFFSLAFLLTLIFESQYFLQS